MKAMAIPSIHSTVSSLLDSLVTSLHKTYAYDFTDLSSYAQKEISRFSNKQLFDPIARVARHPLRKLRPKPNGRLVERLKCVSNRVLIVIPY